MSATTGAPADTPEPIDSDLFAELKAGMVRLDIDGTTFWRAESDLLLDEDQLFVYSQQRAAQRSQQRANELSTAFGLGGVARAADATSSDLVGILRHERIVRWHPGTILTYCVLKRTFPDGERYDEVVAQMTRATADWEASCGVRFEHDATLDGSTSLRPEGVVFPVRFIDAGGQFIAAAFPNDPPDRRRVFIDPSYFSTSFDHAGVLRHELGHVLGFRHEHIRSGAPPICPDEDTEGTFAITDYDPKSVMHYFCGGAGRPELTISAADRIGSQSVYGPPLAGFEMVEA